jgi:hypothetical protein
VLQLRRSHSLGNLTLLAKPLNSSVSNGSFRAKRSQISGQSRLILNAHFQRFTDNDVWNEKTISRRAEELTQVAVRIWPHPGPPATQAADTPGDTDAAAD